MGVGYHDETACLHVYGSIGTCSLAPAAFVARIDVQSHVKHKMPSGRHVDEQRNHTCICVYTKWNQECYMEA
jgi:hypothetical protein